MRIEYQNLQQELRLEQIVYDKRTNQNAKIVLLNPLTIQLDAESQILVERQPTELEYYIWTKEDLEEIHLYSKRFSSLLK